MAENPFELLRLPPEASEDEIVRPGARLCQTAADTESRDGYREAVRLLTASPSESRLHALLTPPAPAPASSELARFQSAFRRPPAGEAAAVPPLDQAEAVAILRGLL